MTHRALGALLLLGVLVVLAGAPGGVAMARPSSASSSSTATASAPAPPDTIVTPLTDNDFIPDRDLDDCVSALPQPGCGNQTRSGWRQWVIFGLLVVALAFIAWRILRSIRRAQRAGDRGSDDT